MCVCGQGDYACPSVSFRPLDILETDEPCLLNRELEMNSHANENQRVYMQSAQDL